MEKPRVYISSRDVTVHGQRGPTSTQIVCGDCSERADEKGDVDLLPVRTFLSMDGRCYTCGGASFVIASELCLALRRTIERRRWSGRERSSSQRQQVSPGLPDELEAFAANVSFQERATSSRPYKEEACSA